ncbi:putative non-specific protein-tyrosine kinase [Helianthus debilis subsp. tardiflorus]
MLTNPPTIPTQRSSPQIVRRSNRRVSMVSTLKHKNIAKLRSSCVEGNTRILAYEFASMGSLHYILHGPLPPSTLNPIAPPYRVFACKKFMVACVCLDQDFAAQQFQLREEFAQSWLKQQQASKGETGYLRYFSVDDMEVIDLMK